MENEEEEARQKRLLLKLRLNRAHCCCKIPLPKRACLELAKAIEMDPKNPKALYRMGKAKAMLGNDVEAKKYFLRADKAKPGDPDIGNALLQLEKKVRQERANEKVFCQKMFFGDEGDAMAGDVAIKAENVEHNKDVDDDFYDDVSMRLQGKVK